ncbi:transposase [Streptomyces sp. NPDC048430]|uniref:transposase n=1 Tax=Streptomyces sp. NPDC048430 TaxID=3155388 RepID=UPI003441C0F9
MHGRARTVDEAISAYLSHALADLPMVLVGRLRSARVTFRDAGEVRSVPRGGPPRKHGGVLTFAKPESWHAPEVTTVTDTTRYGKAAAMAWDRMHPRLTHRSPCLEHAAEELPLLHGTLNLDREPARWVEGGVLRVSGGESRVRVAQVQESPCRVGGFGLRPRQSARLLCQEQAVAGLLLLQVRERASTWSVRNSR